MSNQLERLGQGNTEPLLDGEEAGAVNNLLRYLENGEEWGYLRVSANIWKINSNY